MLRRLPPLHALPPEKIDEIIGDLRHRQSGDKLYYTLDPNEVSDFCFPINPNKLRRRDIDSIAEDQAALYEVFYMRNESPILLEDYRDELKDFLNYFEHTVDNVYTKAEMVETLLKEAGLSKLLRQEYKSKDRLLRIVEEDFNIMLAVAMGIYSLGVERFLDILKNHLEMNSIGTQDLTVLEIYEACTKEDRASSERVNLILNELEKGFEHERPSHKRQLRRYALMDALAIDRLLYLNSALENAYQEGKLHNRHIFLYLSSAPRTARIFDMKEIEQSLPIINGRPYSIWRSRSQTFAYVVHKSKRKDIGESIENLTKVRGILEEVRNVGQDYMHSVVDCPKCILEGGKVDYCKWLPFCQKVKDLDDAIQTKRAEIQNLGLFSQLNNYNQLIKVTPKIQSHKDFIAFFSQFYKEEFNKKAMRRMQELQWLVITKSEFAKLLPAALGIGRLGTERALLREGRDVVVGLSQYLPLRPKVKAEEYKPIIDLILNCYKIPPQGAYKLELMDKAYTLFIGIDAAIDKLDLEHELVRCLLYLAFPKLSGDKRAYEHAEEMLKEEDLIKPNPEIEAEYYYVLLWAARRSKRYQEGDRIATEAIYKWSSDPRFYHGRSLNTFSWLTDIKRKENCPYTIEHAIKDASDAVSYFFKGTKEPVEYRDIEVIGANFNNLAYFWAQLYISKIDNGEEAPKALNEARYALKEMKKWTHKETWEPDHPEYFHTEAYVEYHEYLFYKDQKDTEYLTHKLENALREIDTAVRLYPRQNYVELKDTIETELYNLKGTLNTKNRFD